MSLSDSFLSTISNPISVITPIENGVTFPQILDITYEKYIDDIKLFRELIMSSQSSEELLFTIRSNKFNANSRMSLLKMFRRCVSLVCDTETTKKIQKVSTEDLIANYGPTFKPIEQLQSEFNTLTEATIASLTVLIGEYDGRGRQGYVLTDLFFSWFERTFPDLEIIGPRGAGKDIELADLLEDFHSRYPCDFVIRDKVNFDVIAVGFARYDSTRGGAQSDDRTGGNLNKVDKAKEYFDRTGKLFKIIFVSDGPGLIHNDTWAEACDLDGMWGDNVRVTTLKLASSRITRQWML